MCGLGTLVGLLGAAVAVPPADDCCEPHPKFSPDAKLAMSANGSLFVDGAVVFGGGFDCDDEGDVSVLVGRKSSALPINADALPNGSKFDAGAAVVALKFKPKLFKSDKFDVAFGAVLLFVGANAPNKSSKPCDGLTCDSESKSGIAEGATGAADSAVSNDPSKSKLASFAGTFEPLLLVLLFLLFCGRFKRSTSAWAMSGIAFESFDDRSFDCDDTGIGGFAGLAGGWAGLGGGIDDRAGAGGDGLGGGGRSCDFDVGLVTKGNKKHQLG